MKKLAILSTIFVTALLGACSTNNSANAHAHAPGSTATSHATVGQPNVGDILSGNETKFNNAEAAGGTTLTQPQE